MDANATHLQSRTVKIIKNRDSQPMDYKYINYYIIIFGVGSLECNV